MSLFEHIFIIILLITISAFFSMSEIALAAARKLRLRQLVAEGEARASKVLELQQHPGNFFTIVQIGLNAVAILGGILGEAAFTPYIADLLRDTYNGPLAGKYQLWLVGIVGDNLVYSICRFDAKAPRHAGA